MYTAINFHHMPTSNTNPASKRIALTRTQGEWEAIDKILKENKSEFHSYLRRESSRLRNAAKECLACVTPAGGPKKQRRHNIPTDIYNDLLEIARLAGKEVGDVLDELLLTPLLLPGKDAAL